MLPSVRSLFPIVSLALATAGASFVACSDDATTNPLPSSSSTSTGSTDASGATSSSGAGGATGGASTTGTMSASGSGGSTSSAGGAGGATGGSSSTSAAGGAATSSSSGAGGSGGGLGSGCKWGDACANGFFCDAPGCGQGQCALKPNPAAIHGEQELVCGCDGATYWNEDSASYAGVATKAMGECPGNQGIPCSAQTPCGAGQFCKLTVASQAQCASSPTGVCWGLPLSCPVGGPQGKACTTQTCESQCSLIASNNPWYDDGLCP